MSLDYEQIKQEVKEEIMQSLSTRFNHEKERSLQFLPVSHAHAAVLHIHQ